MTSRKVTFGLAFSPDPSIKPVLDQFGKAAVETYDRIAVSAREAASQISEDFRKQSATAIGSQTEIESARKASAAAEGERVAKSTQKFSQGEREKVRIAQDTAKAIAAAEKDFERQYGKITPEVSAKLRVAIEADAAAQIAALENGVTETKKRESTARVTETRRATSIHVASTKLVTEASTKSAAALQDNARRASREVMASFAELGDSVMKIARGFVALGLVGEKDLDKVKDRLLAMQATFDLLGGSIQTFLKITKSVEALRNATIAATAAQHALNQAQSAGSRNSMFAVGMGGLATLGGTVSNALQSRAAARAAEVAALRNAAMLGTGGVAATAAPTIGTGAMLTGAGVGAAVVGAGFSLFSAYKHFGQMGKQGFGEGADVGSFTERIGGSTWNPFTWGMSAQRSRISSDKSLASAEKERLQRIEQATLRDSLIGDASSRFSAASAQSRASRESGFELGMLGESDAAGARSTAGSAAENARLAAARQRFEKFQDERVAIAGEASAKIAADEVKASEKAASRLHEIEAELARERSALQQARSTAQGSMIDENYKATESRLTKEIADEEQRIVDYRSKAASLGEDFLGLRQDYLQNAEDSEKRVLTLLQRKRDLERETGAERRRVAEESLRFSEQELDVVKARLDAARNSLMSAKERFGLMDSGAQADIVSLAGRARKGADLSPEELKRLQGLGLESTDALVRRQAMARAEAGGFGGLAGDDEKRVEALRKMQDRLSVEVEDKRQIVVNVQQNTDTLAGKVVDALKARLAESDKLLIDKVDGLAKQVNQLRMAQINGAGRG